MNFLASCFLLLASYKMDTSIALYIHQFTSPFLDAFFGAITAFGSTKTLAIVTILFSLILIISLRFHKAHVLLLAAIFSSVTSIVIKHIIERPRPTLWPQAEMLNSYSFPSGHALVSTVIYGILAFFLAERYPNRRTLIYAAFLLLIFTVGTSRIYLGVHWPSDVLGGWAIGALLLAAMIRWYHKGSIGRIIRIGVGLFAIGLGLIGLILPVIPGLPLLIAGALLVFSGRPLFATRQNN